MAQIRTISIRGKQYVTVAERVRLVHEQRREFEVVESQPLEVGARLVWRVVVKVDGHHYTGCAEVKLDAREGSPDFTNPFECAETSAVGRALAWAGFGSVDSIASADELLRSQEPQDALKVRKNALFTRCKAVGRCTDKASFLAYAAEVYGVETLSASEMTVDILDLVEAALDNENVAQPA